MTIYHLRDLAMNRRLRIKCEDVKVFQAPHYKGLSIEDMMCWAKQHPVVEQALPSEPRELLKLHRDYVSTVIYTLVGHPFVDWVESRIKLRN
jgi:hypothetical protein